MLRLATDPDVAFPRDSLLREKLPTVMRADIYRAYTKCANDFSGLRRIRRSCSTRRSGANAPVTLGRRNNGQFLLGASAGFALDNTLSTQHDADSCATYPQQLPLKARAIGALDDALITPPATALLSMKSANLSSQPPT